MSIVYEVVDVTDEDIFYTCGLWPTLDEAIAALGTLTDPDEAGDVEHDDEGYAKFEVRERKFGWGDTGKVVFVQEWDYDFGCDDEGEEVREAGWVVRPTTSPK